MSDRNPWQFVPGLSALPPQTPQTQEFEKQSAPVLHKSPSRARILQTPPWQAPLGQQSAAVAHCTPSPPQVKQVPLEHVEFTSHGTVLVQQS